MVRNRVSFFALLVGLACVASDTVGQLKMASGQDGAGTPATAAQRVPVRLSGMRIAPYGVAAPGRLVTMAADVRNSGDVPHRVLVLARLEGTNEQLTGSQLDVPPGELRTATLHLRIPADTPPGKVLSVQLSLNRADTEQPIVLTTADGRPMIDTYPVSVGTEHVVTALWSDVSIREQPEWDWPLPPPDYSYEWVVGARIDSMFSRRVVNLTRFVAPCQLADWDAFDTAVIASGGVLEDAAAVETMRRWLATGGRMWVMLDQIRPEAIRELLPDGALCEMIDDVELTDFVVDQGSGSLLNERDRRVRLEQPVVLRRVTQSGGRVTASIGGYPTVIWYPVGRGVLLVTTLEAPAWLFPRQDQRSSDPLMQSQFQVRPWGATVGPEFFQPSATAWPLDTEQVTYPLQQIGNPVVSKQIVMFSLLTFFSALVAGAVWCYRGGQLMRFGWLAPAIAVLAAMPLLVASQSVRREVGSSSASLQLIEVLPGGHAIAGQQLMATYLGRADSSRLQGQVDARIRFPENEAGRDIRRWVWEDFQSWHLSSSGWPAGLWRSEYRFSLPPRQLDALGELDERGLTLRLPAGLGENLEDAVLNYVVGDPVLCGRVPVGGSVRVDRDTLRGGVAWVTDTLVTDEQMRRSEVYTRLASTEGKRNLPAYPALMGWTRLWETGKQWGSEREEPGAALVCLPVRLQDLPEGRRVQIPHSLIQVSAPLVNNVISTAFSNEHGRWREASTFAVNAPVRFTLPPQVLPFAASEIVCELQVRAPQRTVTIRTADLQRVIAERQSPLDRITLRLTDPELLADLADGTIDFWVEVSERAGQVEAGADIGTWQIDYFQMNVTGEVAPAPLVDASLSTPAKS
jgi:hypothetical protein